MSGMRLTEDQIDQAIGGFWARRKCRQCEYPGKLDDQGLCEKCGQEKDMVELEAIFAGLTIAGERR